MSLEKISKKESNENDRESATIKDMISINHKIQLELKRKSINEKINFNELSFRKCCKSCEYCQFLSNYRFTCKFLQNEKRYFAENSICNKYKEDIVNQNGEMKYMIKYKKKFRKLR